MTDTPEVPVASRAQPMAVATTRRTAKKPVTLPAYNVAGTAMNVYAV